MFFNEFFIRRYLLLLQCFYYYMLFHCLSGTSTYLYPLLYLSNHFYSTQIMYIHINYQLFKIIKLLFANNLFKFFLISFNKFQTVNTTSIECNKSHITTITTFISIQLFYTNNHSILSRYSVNIIFYHHKCTSIYHITSIYQLDLIYIFL